MWWAGLASSWRRVIMRPPSLGCRRQGARGVGGQALLSGAAAAAAAAAGRAGNGAAGARPCCHMRSNLLPWERGESVNSARPAAAPRRLARAGGERRALDDCRLQRLGLLDAPLQKPIGLRRRHRQGGERIPVGAPRGVGGRAGARGFGRAAHTASRVCEPWSKALGTRAVAAPALARPGPSPGPERPALPQRPLARTRSPRGSRPAAPPAPGPGCPAAAAPAAPPPPVRGRRRRRRCRACGGTGCPSARAPHLRQTLKSCSRTAARMIQTGARPRRGRCCGTPGAACQPGRSRVCGSLGLGRAGPGPGGRGSHARVRACLGVGRRAGVCMWVRSLSDGRRGLPLPCAPRSRAATCTRAQRGARVTRAASGHRSAPLTCRGARLLQLEAHVDKQHAHARQPALAPRLRGPQRSVWGP